MTPAEYLAHVNASPAGVNFGSYYGPAQSVPGPGYGLIYQEIPYPRFDKATSRYQVRAGSVCVLTHECDIDPSNSRPFNDIAAVIPIIPMAGLTSELEASLGEAGTKGFIANVASRNVERLFFLPQYATGSGAPCDLDCGGFLYLNHIVSVPVSSLETAKLICALSDRGMGALDDMLKSNLFRPKADPFPSFLGTRFVPLSGS